MSTEHTPHSELRQAVVAALSDHSWEWKDLNDHVAQSEHAPGCRRCKADAALDSLEEQHQRYEEALHQIKDNAHIRNIWHVAKTALGEVDA